MEKDNKNINISEVSVFKDKSNVFFAFKKTEKISAALYMLSNLLSDKEPLKWEIRTAALNLLDESLKLTDRKNLSTLLIKVISLIEIAFLSDLISEMNYKVFKQELHQLIKLVEDLVTYYSQRNFILPENFFAVEPPISSPNGVKDNNIMSDRMSVKNSVHNVKDNKTIVINRQEIILSLLKNKGELGIKDFVSAIKDCSEKTVQRELANMITLGQIKKTGEKRWSRYSLK